MWKRGARDLGRMIESGEISSLEMTRYFIERIERLDGKINSVVVRAFDRALRKAEEAEKGKELFVVLLLFFIVVLFLRFRLAHALCLQRLKGDLCCQQVLHKS